MTHFKTATEQVGTTVRIRKENPNTMRIHTIERVLKVDNNGFYVSYKDGKLRLEEKVTNNYHDLKVCGFEF